MRIEDLSPLIPLHDNRGYILPYNMGLYIGDGDLRDNHVGD